MKLTQLYLCHSSRLFYLRIEKQGYTGQQKRVLQYHITATREKKIMQRAMSHCSCTNCQDRTLATVCKRKKRCKWDNAMQHHM
jgi:hypothetical protein